MGRQLYLQSRDQFAGPKDLKRSEVVKISQKSFNFVINHVSSKKLVNALDKKALEYKNSNFDS